MNISESVKIKKEKVDLGYEALNKAENLPIPIKIKEERDRKNEGSKIRQDKKARSEKSVIPPGPIVIKTQMLEKENAENDDSKLKGKNVQIKKERNVSPEIGVTPPKPIIVKVQPSELESNDMLSFLDEISEEIDDLIPIEPAPLDTITIDDEDQISIETRAFLEKVQNHKKRKKSSENETQNIDDSTEILEKSKKHKKKNKKRRLSSSPVDIKLKRNYTNVTETKGKFQLNDDSCEYENNEPFPRKVFNYNHSSLPKMSKSNENDLQKSPDCIKIKQERKSPILSETVSKGVDPPLPKILKVEKTSLSEGQIDQVIKNCNKALKRLRIFKTDPYFSRLLYTPTKLIIPLTNKEKECRSPLLRSNYVRFKFSSTNSQINYGDFNLISLSENITRVSKLLGLEIIVLNDWIINFGKDRLNRNPKFKVGKQVIDSSAFYVSKSTQTMDISCPTCLARSLSSKRNVAVSAKCETYEFGTQTTQKEELPILKMIPYLNANQLLALNDFAALLREHYWETADSSLRLNIRDKLLHYFQEGQKQCNVPGMRTLHPHTGISSRDNIPISNYNLTNIRNIPPAPPIIPNLPYNSQSSTLYQNASTNIAYLPHTHAGRATDPRLNRNADVPRYH